MTRPLSGLLTVALTYGPAAGAAEVGFLDLRVRDAITGYAVPAILELDAGKKTDPRTSWQLDGSGGMRLQLDAGEKRVRVSSPGYHAIGTQLQIDANAAWPVTIWMDPEQRPDELRPEALAAHRVAGSALLHGWVVDATSGEPLPGAEVSFGGERAQSGLAGYFSFNVPVQSGAGEELPESGDLLVQRPGHRSYVLANTALVEGDSQLVIQMHKGSGTEVVDDTHKLLRSPAELEQSQSAPGALPEVAGPTLDTTRVLAPPPSIRVGYSCSCTNCSTVEVMSLETYVKRGLPREWIASWEPHSLRAGAIAYRSYGSWYVAHPLRPNYDICNTACCQVNLTGTFASTDSAVEYTGGILLHQNGAVFRAEYSAENNNLCGVGCSNGSCTCGDGNAGSPGTGWPCVTEPYDAGHACAGHGRGMCQWGTQRGARSGQLWSWIENHYYNNNGSPGGTRSAYMTSPLDISMASADPGQVSPGGVFAIQVSALNYSELAHTQVMLGASLYLAGTGYISDSSSDQKVTLYPGSTDVSRTFTLPDSAPSGSYDLIVALWLDVNEDSAITGADLPLVSYVVPGAVMVP